VWARFELFEICWSCLLMPQQHIALIDRRVVHERSIRIELLLLDPVVIFCLVLLVLTSAFR
jgi:hypothetical protein